VRFGFVAEGAFFEANEETAQKIFAALGLKKAFSTGLKIECGASDITVADEGIAASVLETLDYGTEKFLKCAVGENIVYVKCDAEKSGDIRLLPDFGRVGVVETEREIKII
ncbi:MAG: hypothetical protein K2I29_03900, partial [Clostridia bacterium]|nr:hypothetical protein [Clostridia bacterium]